MSRANQPKPRVPSGNASNKHSLRRMSKDSKFSKRDFPSVANSCNLVDSSNAVQDHVVVAPKSRKLDEDVDSYEVILDLKRMEDGWAGPDSAAPNSAIIDAVCQLIVLFGWKENDIPGVQIDDGDGSILIIWKLDKDRECAIDIFCDGTIKCAVTSLSKQSAVSETYNASNLHNLSQFIDSAHKKMTSKVKPCSQNCELEKGKQHPKPSSLTVDSDQSSCIDKDTKEYEVILDLKRMKDGWDGPDSKAPSRDVIEALYQVFLSLNWEDTDIPRVEIEDDGSITMIWILDNGNICSVDIFSDAKTIITHTSETDDDSVSKTVDPHDNKAVLEFFKSFNAI